MAVDWEAWLRNVRQAVRAGSIEWKQHALERLLTSGIRMESVEQAILEGEIVEFYPDAYPVPAGLLLHIVGEDPLHVVVAFDEQNNGICHVITAYRPSPDKFEMDWKTRKS